MIRWPAIIHYAGAAELDYIHDEAAWQQEVHSPGSQYLPEDRLIDVKGRVYQISNTHQPVATLKRLSLPQVIELVRAHAAQAGQCCISKLSASTMAGALSIVRSITADTSRT